MARSKIATALMKSYLPLRNRWQRERIAKRVLAKTAKMSPRTEHGKRLLFTAEALAGYKTLIEPGERVLSSAQDDPDLVEEVQAEQERIQESLDVLDDQMATLVDEHARTTERRNFWSEEMERLSNSLQRGTLVVNQYAEDRPWKDGKPHIIRTKVFRFKTREEQREAKSAIDTIKRKVILPELRKERVAAKELAAQIAPYEDQKRELQAELDEWSQYYTDPDLYSKEYVRFARYWRDFLDTVKQGGNHYKPLSNIGANPPLFRYRRAKLRIIFRRVSRGLHILRIATRSDDTYAALKHLIDESDRHL